MYIYRVYGLTLGSEIPLGSLPSSQGEPQVYVRRADLHFYFRSQLQVGSSLYVGYLYSPETCRLVVRNGNEVLLDPLVPMEPLRLEHLLLGPIMSILLMQRGATVLHGSCVALGEEAVGFIGRSGAGKSTLAYSLAARGHRVLCDDLMLLQMSEQGDFWVTPAYPRISLRRDSVILSGTCMDGSVGATLKAFYGVDDQFETCSCPLGRIYFLHEDDRVSLVESSPSHSLVNLIHHSRPSPFFEDPATVAPLLGRYQRLVQAVPMYTLTRTNSLSKMEQLLRLVEDHRPGNIQSRISPPLALQA